MSKDCKHITLDLVHDQDGIVIYRCPECNEEFADETGSAVR